MIKPFSVLKLSLNTTGIHFFISSWYPSDLYAENGGRKIDAAWSGPERASPAVAAVATSNLMQQGPFIAPVASRWGGANIWIRWSPCWRHSKLWLLFFSADDFHQWVFSVPNQKFELHSCWLKVLWRQWVSVFFLVLLEEHVVFQCQQVCMWRLFWGCIKLNHHDGFMSPRAETFGPRVDLKSRKQFSRWTYMEMRILISDTIFLAIWIEHILEQNQLSQNDAIWCQALTHLGVIFLFRQVNALAHPDGKSEELVGRSQSRREFCPPRILRIFEFGEMI